VLSGLNHLFVRDESGDFLRYDKIQSANLDPSAIRAVVEWAVAHLGSGAPRGGAGQRPWSSTERDPGSERR
jgi:hypothetical protein